MVPVATMELTKVDVPCGMPPLDVLPLEQPRQRLDLGWHPGARQLHFFLSEDPKRI